MLDDINSRHPRSLQRPRGLFVKLLREGGYRMTAAEIHQARQSDVADLHHERAQRQRYERIEPTAAERMIERVREKFIREGKL